MEFDIFKWRNSSNSYKPEFKISKIVKFLMAETKGLEPSTSGVTGQRSKPTELRLQLNNILSMQRRFGNPLFYKKIK